MKEVVWVFIEDATGRFLMLQRADHNKYAGIWTTPGGKVEYKDKTLVHAAVRETAEETGLYLTHGNLRFVGEQTAHKDALLTKDYHLNVYHYRVPNNSTIDLEDEFCGCGWFTIDQILELPRFPDTDAALNLVRKNGWN